MNIAIRACLQEEMGKVAELFYTIRKEEFAWLEKEKIKLDDFSNLQRESLFSLLC